MNKQQPQQRLQLDLGEKEAEGIYSNLTLISVSPAEFILDFARMLPGNPKAKVHSRVVMTPQAAKAFAKNLMANVERYEEKNGEIKLAGQPEPGPGIGFQTD